LLLPPAFTVNPELENPVMMVIQPVGVRVQRENKGVFTEAIADIVSADKVADNNLRDFAPPRCISANREHVHFFPHAHRDWSGVARIADLWRVGVELAHGTKGGKIPAEGVSDGCTRGCVQDEVEGLIVKSRVVRENYLKGFNRGTCNHGTASEVGEYN
jgi:hypothetical protein